MNIKKLLEEFNQLNLPQDQYAITSSGCLAIRGLREVNDLDVLVSDKLWEELIKKYPANKENPYKIELGNIEILGRGTIFRNQGLATVEELIETADVIDGHRFVKLNLLKEFKRKLGREKDLKDIALIDQYLSENISI